MRAEGRYVGQVYRRARLIADNALEDHRSALLTRDRHAKTASSSADFSGTKPPIEGRGPQE